MNKLHIGEGFNLPLDFVTQTQAILAKRGVGKSYTASVEAEELLKAEQQVVVIDPTGAWFGLKSSEDGKRAGFPVAIFGGEHADVPLEEGAGEVIAQAIVEQRFSAILDLSLFRKGQVSRFMGVFLETLYRLNREAMHLVVDEADAIAPQRPFADEARMLGAMEDVVRRGRRRGIGCTLITQRPQVLNKNVLTQCEILCAMRLIHPKDIDAIEEWVAVHGDPELAKQMIRSLPNLSIGTAWFWAPGWGDIFQQVKVRRRETFDSSATPKAGEVQRKPAVLADVDIAQLGQQIKDTAQRAKENDPAQLKRRIADLERQTKAKAPAAPVDDSAVQRAVERAVAQRDQEHKRQLAGHQAVIEKMQSAFASIGKLAGQFVSVELPKEAHAPLTISLPPRAPASPRAVQKRKVEASGELTGPEQRIVNAIAWLNSIGVKDPEQTAVAFLAGYTVGGGAFNNPRGALKTKGYIEYLPGDRIRLTEEGECLAEVPDAPLDAKELQQRVLERLPGPERKILTVLLEHREGMANEDLAAASGYASGGGAYNNPRGRLRTLGLVDYQNGVVKPKPLLFLES